MSRFADATALAASSNDDERDHYSGEIHEGWDILGNANGGYLMALLGRAALLSTGRTDIISLSANFLSPGKPGHVTATANAIKAGRRFATTGVELSGPDKMLLHGTVITGDLDDGDGPTLITEAPPDVPPPDACVRTEPTDLFPPPFMGRIDQRLHPDDVPGSPNGPRIRGWFRLLDDEPLDTLAVILAADSFPPPVFNTELPLGWVPTVQMSVHVRSRPTTPWLLLDTQSRFIQGGMFETDANIFDEHGVIVGQSRQLQLIARG